MNLETKLLEIAAYTVPALITGGVAYFVLQSFFKNEENRRRFELLKENQKQALPIRLQAYERMVLFLERINPPQLLLRVAPISSDKHDYATILIHSIQTEFEHNLTQQVYVTAPTWEVVMKAKNSIVQMIRQKSVEEEIVSAEKLREAILIDLTQNESPSAIAISYLKEDLKKVF
ncbi:MAG: hypothetical protein MUF43_08280 [Flavobacterium sp.]|jgi:hypothetical protein|nr:hypothetical protein [Flavobacterium sp.]